MVFNELLALQQQYFNSSTTHDWDCARFDYYLLSKAAITLAQSLSMIYTLYGVTSSPSISFLIMILMVIVLQNVLFFVEMHYFIAVLYIYRYFWLLHQQFECVRLQRNQPSAVRNVTAVGIQNCLHPAKSLVEEFNRMTDIYIRLMYVSAKLSRLYEQQLLMLIGSFVSANVQSLFYICVFFSGKIVEVTFENFFYFSQGFIVNVIDFWINITVCEHTLRTASETLSFLQIFGEYTNLDREEAQSLEMFSILCCSHTLDFRICDFFELNHSTGHRVLMTAILYLVFLVQFDYMNL
ncbi:gustatory receptor for bitter taste 22e-like [Teleopsis dalmanni]|uniref:gustatory receptor for bitter taste 22e-like n=1 Tax=Teleopsis dalmanni TaxID=139649 RepID=UPI0018CF2F11|nr:gustatory receptor for bitter taste 22e-like [Teleopsis dalmanni]